MSVFNWHMVRIKDCIRCAQWRDAVLFCPACQRELALRYTFGEEVRVYVHPKFKRYKSDIETREDTAEVTNERDLLGKIDFREWGDFLHDFQSREDAIFPLQEDREWISEDCEGCKSGELQPGSRSTGGAESNEETKGEDTEVNQEG